MAELFKSANAAVRFAVNYGNDGHIERSAMNKITDTSKGADTGLEQGQAGAIQAMIKGTGEFHEACLIARSAAHKIPCSCGSACCSKYRPNWIWLEAINYLALEIKNVLNKEKSDGTRGITDNPAMRRAIVAKYFGERIKIGELAKAVEVSDATVSSHNGKIIRILKHSEGEAWSLIEERLRIAHIIE